MALRYFVWLSAMDLLLYILWEVNMHMAKWPAALQKCVLRCSTMVGLVCPERYYLLSRCLDAPFVFFITKH